MEEKRVGRIKYDELVKTIEKFMDVKVKTVIEVFREDYRESHSSKFDLEFEFERTKKEGV